VLITDDPKERTADVEWVGQEQLTCQATKSASENVDNRQAPGRQGSHGGDVSADGGVSGQTGRPSAGSSGE
jgi:hypothetical protein